MRKWVILLLLVVVLAVGSFVAYGVYEFFKGGFHTRPDMPPGAFSISYTNGMRAILVDVPNERETRRYFGYPAEVPFYIEDAWSFCSPPNAEEAPHIEQFMAQRDYPGERFEAVCKVAVDDETVIRGMITSVPKL